MSGRPFDPADLQARLQRAWSLETSSRWSPDNPACGQCSVTALAVHKLYGGELLKTPAPGGMHFYNRIAGKRWDFTASQFAEPIAYADEPSSPGEALGDTTQAQVTSLLRTLER